MRRGVHRFIVVSGGLLLSPIPALAGPYSSGYENTTLHAMDPGIPGLIDEAVNPAFIGWATSVISYLPGSTVQPGFNEPSLTLGPVTGDNFDIVSLGESLTAPGQITLGFAGGIRNSSGPDFAVFENSFGADTALFAELGYVEVSTNGTQFARFQSTSLTPASVGAYGSINPTNVHNLAGKHANAFGDSYGTPFDLTDLASDPLVQSGQVNLRDIRYIRVVDIAGNGFFTDSSGRPIFDAYPTTGSPGFDLEAIGVLNDWWDGDANFDGLVNATDLGILALNWQKTGRHFWEGDFTGDGKVDVNDLYLMSMNWQKTDALGLPALPVSVPEPSSLLFLVLAPFVLRNRSRS